MLKQFNYWLTGYGWAEVFFTSDLETVRFEVSYLSDPLDDLITALLELLTNSQNEISVDFFDEPGHHRLTLTLDSVKHVRVSLRMWAETESVADIPIDPSSDKPYFETVSSLENLCSVVLEGIRDLRSRHSDSEYLDKWINYPFPSERFKLLEQVVSEHH
jgi:hypothetical protein